MIRFCLNILFYGLLICLIQQGECSIFNSLCIKRAFFTDKEQSCESSPVRIQTAALSRFKKLLVEAVSRDN